LKGAFADRAAGPAVLLDHLVATFKKEQHLVIPVVDAEPAGERRSVALALSPRKRSRYHLFVMFMGFLGLPDCFEGALVC
jgi:hypothetical protein